jgi:hypothetical protein
MSKELMKMNAVNEDKENNKEVNKKEKIKSQVFQKEVSLQCLYQILLNILQKICIDSNVINHNTNNANEYLVTKAIFKRAEIHNIIAPFISSLKPYYYLSKQHYVDRQINYNSFITILRQLCNVNSIKYTSKIVYIKSNYEIEYTIQFPSSSSFAPIISAAEANMSQPPQPPPPI